MQRHDVKRISDLDEAVPGLGNVWREIKRRIETPIRCPKSLWLREEPAPMHLNDGECGCRYALDLASMTLSDEEPYVSSGEWACHGGSNNDEAVEGVPATSALIEVVWHDYYRYGWLTLQVAPGALRRQFPAKSDGTAAVASTRRQLESATSTTRAA
jgi:hypothetical protein